MIVKYKLFLESFLKKKKLVKFTLNVATIIFLLLILTGYFIKGTKQIYQTKKEEFLAASYLHLIFEKDYNDVIKELNKIEEVKHYYPIKEVVIDDFVFSYRDKAFIELVDGHNIKNDNEILVSNLLSEYQIGDKLIVNNQEYKIVGIYESSKYNIANAYDGSLTSMLCSYNVYYNYLDLSNIKEVMVLADDYDNLNELISKLDDYGIGVYDQNNNILNHYRNLCTNAEILKNILILFETLFIVAITLIVLHDNIFDYAIMRALGYSNIHLLKIVLMELSLILTISFVISFIISLILLILPISFLNFNLISILYVLGLLITGTVLVSIIVIFYLGRISIIKILK